MDSIWGAIAHFVTLHVYVFLVISVEKTCLERTCMRCCITPAPTEHRIRSKSAKSTWPFVKVGPVTSVMRCFGVVMGPVLQLNIGPIQCTRLAKWSGQWSRSWIYPIANEPKKNYDDRNKNIASFLKTRPTGCFGQNQTVQCWTSIRPWS